MKDQPLRCSMEGDELVIRIGVDTLAFADEQREPFTDYDDEVGDWVQKIKITNPLQWGKDVCAEINNEREDGSSPLTDFLDKMAENAIEQGSQGIWYKELGFPDPTVES